ncbi:MAG: phosphoglycerate mutase family protein [Lachnospiraceae bacterium]|nr:phosphoglycerate mutase family protein [Lachnospiraceae bacterium]
MRILLIRHAEPDYTKDVLTAAGRKEAAALAALAPQLNLGTCYVSPLGRAQETASYCLAATGKTARTCDWLREFPAALDLNNCPELQKAYPGTKADPETGIFPKRIVWDMVPSYLCAHPDYIDPDKWRNTLVAGHSDLVPVYDHVAEGLDALLASHGYVRDGRHYRVEKETTGTLTLFCHFGVSCVILSHLFNCSPFLLWHSICLSPSSVSEIYSEERQEGFASFRALRLGDTTHLTMAGLTPTYIARFCEVYHSEDRHN